MCERRPGTEEELNRAIDCILAEDQREAAARKRRRPEQDEARPEARSVIIGQLSPAGAAST